MVINSRYPPKEGRDGLGKAPQEEPGSQDSCVGLSAA